MDEGREAALHGLSDMLAKLRADDTESGSRILSANMPEEGQGDINVSLCGRTDDKRA